MGVVHNDENKNGDRRYPRGMNHGNESPELLQRNGFGRFSLCQ